MRDPAKTRSSILQAAQEVVYRKGFRASSVDDIVEAAGLTQGAFFHYFPTKKELGYALADEILKEMMLDRWTRPLAAYRDPVKGMIARFRRNMEATTDEEMSLGCPLNNLTQEMSSVDPIFGEKLRGVLSLWIDETEKYLKKARTAGYLRPDVDTKRAAEFVVMAEEGSAALVKNLMDRKAYWSLYESFKWFLESLSIHPGEKR